MKMQRPFASGSRQAPDPYDQYLEQRGFYRKHTARDSSCLFRTISEQMYDTQLHHLAIRQRCVDYMRKYKKLYQKSVDRDIDEYLDEMCKPKTFGTLLELQALAYLYQRNLILFEAYNTGNVIVEDRNFNKVFRVFFTPEKHFDSVFTTDFIEVAAFCQGICYEVLYKNVFKLPDVTYAVEHMLHGNSMEFVVSQTEYSGQYAKRVILEDGRQFDLSRPDETNCILENQILCHFHNPNFPQFADNLHHDIETTYDYENIKITKTIDSLLPEKYVSCVRQLLKEGITPFPYKVSKALDPDIYRNIEFDAWSDIRKEQRFKNWYNGGNNLQIGVKCLVKLRGSQNNLYNCHIQEMSTEKGPCLVYIEELAEKHMVPYESLQPLPSDLAKPWPLPFRYQKHIERTPSKGIDSKKLQRHGKRQYRDVSPNYNIISTIKKEIYSEDEISTEKDITYQLNQFTSIRHFLPPAFEIMAMPLTVDHGNENSRRNSSNSGISQVTNGTEGGDKHELKKDDESDLEYASTNEQYPYAYGGYDSYPIPIPYEGVIHSASHGPYYCMYSGQPFSTQPNSMVTHGVYVQPSMHCSQQVPPNVYFPAPPPCFGALPSTTSTAGSSTSSNTVTITNICRRAGSTNAVSGRINLSAGRSILPSGSDLPSDTPTLRFFYNLGYDYFKQMHNPNSDDIKIDVNKLSSDIEGSLKIENDNYSSFHQMKSDQNNNTTNGNHQNSKRFPSRYFNGRRGEKSNYRGGYTNGGSNHRVITNTDTYGKSNMSNKNNSTSTANTANSSNSKISSTNNSFSTFNSTEQAIQTSPTSALHTSETWSNDLSHTPTLYNAQAGPLQFGPSLPFYTDNDQPNMYFQQPTVMAVPYGMFPAPPPPPPHGAGFPAYLPPPNVPPIPISSSFPPSFITPGNAVSEPSSAVINSDAVESGSFGFMRYSPLYSPISGSNGISTNGTAIPQGYWFPPAPQPPPPLPSIAIAATVANTNTTPGNYPSGTAVPNTNNVSR